MNHSELTKHIRLRIKKAGIKARVRKDVSCGHKCIRVATATYEQNFTLEEQKLIARIAHGNGLTYAIGLEVEENTPTGNEPAFYL